MSESYRVGVGQDESGTCEPREEGELVQNHGYGAAACVTNQSTGEDHDNEA